MARSFAHQLMTGRHDVDEDHRVAPAKTEDPFLAEVWACLKELSRQQRTVLLADLSAGGMACAATLAQELKTTRNTIYVARNAGRKAIRLALMKRGYGLGFDTAWARPVS